MATRDTIPTVEAVLHEERSYTLTEVCAYCRIEREVLISLVKEGLVHPEGAAPEQWRFPTGTVARIHVALRLQNDLDLNVPGTVLAVDLLEEVKALRRRVLALERLLNPR